MKKWIAMLLALAVMLSLAACGGGSSAKSDDPTELYRQVVAKTNDAKTMDADMVMKIGVAYEGGTMDTSVNMRVKSDLTDENNPKVQLTGDMTVPLVGTVQMNECFVDGVMYVNTMDQKIKSKMDYEKVKEQMDTLLSGDLAAAEDLTEITAEQDGENTILRFRYKTDATNSFLNNALQDSLGDEENPAQSTFEEFGGTITIDADGAPVAMTMKVVMTMAQDGMEIKLNLDANEEIHSIGQPVEITAPADAAEYEDAPADTVSNWLA